MKTPDLKPCPFCGRKAALVKFGGVWIVGCGYEQMCYGNINHITMCFVSAETAAETWNRRANDDT